jgi:filamentous hemagglutinin family protein
LYCVKRTSRLAKRLRVLHGPFATMTAVAALMVWQRPAIAGPTGGTVVTGSATISQSGPTTNINQSSNSAIINWQSFSIGAKETVNFNQPGINAVTLNRVIGNETSIIAGALNANGKIFLINSAGVLFTKGAQVNVGGLVASTLDISNSDFMAGKYTFSGTSAASVTNLGQINASPGGYVALLGKTVSNQGVINAKLGIVAMSSGEKITLNFAGNSLFDVTIDRGTLNALVENKRAIIADGGQVIMTAKAADEVLSSQVNNTGIVQARTIASLTGAGVGQAHLGKIKIVAEGGTANIGGKLDASAPKGGNGGFIETSGSKVKIADNAVITTKSADGKNGTWLIDPDGFTIAASGGDISGATLSTMLGANNVTLSSTNGSGSDGNINVNDAVSWAANNILTLNATNNININKSITATGTSAGLVMNYGGDYNILSPASFSGVGMSAPAGTTFASVTLSGSNASLTINGNAYTLVHNLSDLTGISGTGRFALAQDIDASSYAGTTAVVPNLDGTFVGLGHTVSNLNITSTNDNVGLIGTTTHASLIRDLGIVNFNISTTGANAGALVGQNLGDVSKAYSTFTTGHTASVSASGGRAGGLIGLNGIIPTFNNPGLINTISDSFSDASINAGQSGGLIGRGDFVNVVRSHATGNVTTTSTSGGLIGFGSTINITDSYATGSVTGGAIATQLGGLIGNLSNGSNAASITNSYATGAVTGGWELGGLVGMISTSFANFTIEGSHATGDVTSLQNQTVSQNPGIGGLVGTTVSDQLGTFVLTINNSYATGNVRFTGTLGNGAGGLVGSMTGKAVVSNSFATGNVTGSTTGSGVGGLIGTSSSTDISNSHASGNVSGNLTVGGLAGANTGTITNSSASGNVTGSGNNIGGLVGTNVGSITGSSASGNVNGTGGASSTGGLVGSNAGSITNSFFTGQVRGPSGLTGGIAGATFNGGSITNSWYDGSKNPGLGLTNSLSCCSPAIVNGGGALTSDQAKDIQFYANGTINQVLAARAAFQQFSASAAQAGNTITNTTQTFTNNPPDPKVSTAGTQATMDTKSDTIEDNLNSESERNRRRSNTSRTASRQGGGARRGGNFGATIRSINVEGQRFNLRNNTPGNNAPGNAAPNNNARSQPVR